MGVPAQEGALTRGVFLYFNIKLHEGGIML